MTDTPIAPPVQPRAAKRRSFAGARSTMALIMREMSSTYGRTPGGYLWALLEPVAGIALLSLVFSAAFRTPALGISFPMFYATGLLPFSMYADLQGKVATGLLYSRQLLAYPTVTFLDALLARYLLNLMTQILVGYLILTGIILMFETRITPDLPMILLAFVLAAFLGLGIGTLNAYAFTRSNLYQRTWSILMRPMFLISGIFIMYDTFPQPYRDYLWYNPLIHVTGLARAGFYSTYHASYASVLYVCCVALGSLVLGLVLLFRNHRDLLSNN